MLRRFPAALPGLALLLLAGCAPTAQQRLIGEWEGKMELDQAAVEAKRQETAGNPLAKAGFEMALGLVQNMGVKLHFREDGSLTLRGEVGGVGKDEQGTWEVVSETPDSAVVRLRYGDKDEQKTFRFVGPDELTTDPPEATAGFGQIRLRRRAAPAAG